LLFGGLAAAVVAVALIGVGSDGEIDLPGWTDIPGIDVPFIGDSDVLDCRLSNPEGVLVQMELVDGDESTYGDFQHVWWNGNLIDDEAVTRVDVGVFQISAEVGEQFFALSTLPDPDDRTFCESIDVGN
jgi:hypothetical protein